MKRVPLLGTWVLVGASLLASATRAADVTVSGSGSLGIGSMSGGTVNLGLTPQEARALAGATGQELLKQLTAIVQRINAKPDANAREDKLSIGVAQTFLAAIKGKNVPQADWPVVFGELIGQYRQLGARIEATPVTSDSIKALVSQADAARQRGQFDQADAALAQAAELATQDAQRIAQQAQESTRQAASLHASRATLAFTRLERSQGAALLEKAFALRKSDVSRETLWWLYDAGDAWLTEGQSTAALRAYTTAQKAAAAELAVGDPGNTEWQRDLSVSHYKIGNVQAAQGDSAAALRSFQASLAIGERLAAGDPRNSEWQRDLSVSHNKIGDVQAAQGDSAAALKSFQTGLVLRERLAAGDPRNTRWQRDLSVSHDRIGDVQAAQGDSTAALKSFQAGLAIAERLTASDPRNTEWQRDFSVSHEKIGDVQVAQGDSTAALWSFQTGLLIRERLAASDLRNTQWQRDLSVSHNKIGDVQAAQGDFAAALKSFQADLVIAERLAASDSRNTEWQRDLSVSHDRIGNVQAAQGDYAAALKSYLASLAIRDRLASADPRNTEWQRDIAISCWKLAGLGEVLGSVQVRQAMLQKGLTILITQRDRGQLPASNLGWIKMFDTALQTLK